MYKKILIAITTILTVLIVAYIIYKTRPKKAKYNESKILVVTSLEDEIKNNTIWCGTFNILWNDLKNNLAKQDIKFSENSNMIDNLNKGTFTIDNLNENDYIKFIGNPTPELKEKIEKEIKDKFNETSDILDSINWDNRDNLDILLYTMLKKEFEFKEKFDELEKAPFNSKGEYKYFGINKNSNDKLYNQVQVLYYEDSTNFGIKLLTKTDDEILIMKSKNKKPFKKAYDELQDLEAKYTGSKKFTNEDTLKIPYIDFKIKNNFKELEHQEFKFSDGRTYKIENALQTISFSLNEKGGKIKSEALIDINLTSSSPTDNRYFEVTDNFYLFLKEKDANLPYYASYISDLNLFI